MHEQAIEIALEALERFVFARWIRLQDVAHLADNQGTLTPFRRKGS